MRNKDEIVEDMLELGIIIELSGSYMLTEKYKELTAAKVVIPQPKKVDVNKDIILKVGDNVSEWSEDIIRSEGRARAESFMNACNIPAKAPSGYRLRSLPVDCLRIIDNIVTDKDVSPGDMLASISSYYNGENKYPKAFKNLLLDGEVVDIYNEWISGDFNPNINTATPKTGW